MNRSFVLGLLLGGAARALENAHGVRGGSDLKKVAAMVRAGLDDAWQR
jgi:hypothetical protein